MTKTTVYLNGLVYQNGALDYIIHEEGRTVVQDGEFRNEFNIVDHLGNVRQVIRSHDTQTVVATMETSLAVGEEFSMVSESRQTKPAHNVTVGGNQVAWLNADRGRMVGPGRT